MPLTILIVDDNRDHADTLAVLARLWGHAPAVAYDGPAGLAAAAALRPDCLVLDIHMPGLDRYEVARRVRADPDLAGVMLVAASAVQGPDHDRRAAAGFDYRVPKAADPGALAEVLTMIEEVKRLAARTEHLAERTAAAAERSAAVSQSAELVREVRADLAEVKADIREIKAEIREMKDGGPPADDTGPPPG